MQQRLQGSVMMGFVVYVLLVFPVHTAVTPGVTHAGTDSTDLAGLASYDSPLSGVSSVGNFPWIMDGRPFMTLLISSLGTWDGDNRIGWWG